MSPERKQILLFFILSIILIGIGYVLIFPEVFGFNFLCKGEFNFGGEVTCIDKFGDSLGEPLFYGFRFVALIFLFLLLDPHPYSSWKKFAVWFLPLSVILTAITPVMGEDFNPIPTREAMTIWLGWLYLVISLVIMFISTLRSPHGKRLFFWK